MKRRIALRTMAFVAGGLITVPSWARNWNKNSIASANIFSPKTSATLAELVATIIPNTDTPGAKELGVDVLIQKILKDCYEPAATELFQQGLDKLDAVSQQQFNQTFVNSNTEQRLKIIRQLDKEEQIGSPNDQPSTPVRPNDQANRPQSFLRLAKELTILGYTNSEYVMKNLTGYSMMPGHYHGCVPYSPKN